MSDGPADARDWLEDVAVKCPNPQNFEEQVLSQMSRGMYEAFFYGYTKKQWGREPRELPASIAKRIPIRLTYDDRYFDDTYQGMPTEGYTEMVERMLEGIEVQLGEEFTEGPWNYQRCAIRSSTPGHWMSCSITGLASSNTAAYALSTKPVRVIIRAARR
jgi:UDP-galactopyranose mutase